jgi:hypothetical protein
MIWKHVRKKNDLISVSKFVKSNAKKSISSSELSHYSYLTNMMQLSILSLKLKLQDFSNSYLTVNTQPR